MKVYQVRWGKELVEYEVRETEQLYIRSGQGYPRRLRKDIDAFPTKEAAWQHYLNVDLARAALRELGVEV